MKPQLLLFVSVFLSVASGSAPAQETQTNQSLTQQLLAEPIDVLARDVKESGIS